MKKHLLRYILAGCVFFAFIQQGNAQKVSHIKITESNANRYRDSLKLKIFGSIVFPYDILPDSVVTNVNTIDHYTVFPYNSILYPSGNLDSIDKFSVKLSDNLVDFPLQIPVYLFHPHTSNGKLFIYHSGHCAGAATAEDISANNGGVAPGSIIPALLAEGYTVLAVPMLNYHAITPNGYVCGYNNHDALFTEGHYPYPMAFYFKPLIASLNFLGRNNFSAIYMSGLSGGGWTTSIYPAIDSSINLSFPVAGSWPMPVRSVFYSGGDMEQTYPAIFSRLLDYHEIYTLACLAPARKMLQINNRYDNCCFAGATPHLFYADSVAKALSATDGNFKFYLDETQPLHAISRRALKVILAFINNETAFLQNKPPDTITNNINYFYDIKNNFTTNVPSDNSTLTYSLLKAPSWLSLDNSTGQLSGIVPSGSIIVKPDTISFKVEDTTGRFVVHNYILRKKREVPYFFTKFEDSTTVYFLPQFSGAVQQVNQLISSSFNFNNPSLAVLNISVVNNSVIKLKLNNVLTATDSIGYNGFSSPEALTYSNGQKMEDFGLTKINLDNVSKNYAVAGMIRFNTDTKKFEYFNGVAWVNFN